MVRMRDDIPMCIGQLCRGGCIGRGGLDNVSHRLYAPMTTHDKLVNARVVETKVTMTWVSLEWL